MIESIHFVANEICESGSLTSAAVGNLRDCLQSLGLLNPLVEYLANDFSISPAAIAYRDAFRGFLWNACAPTLSVIVGCIAVPKIITRITEGVI